MSVPLHRKIINFSKAVAKYAKSGFQNVSDEEYEKRISICENCPLNYEGECGLCGCVIAEKALWGSETCPDSKWPNGSENKVEQKKVESRISANSSNPSSTKKRSCQKCRKRKRRK